MTDMADILNVCKEYTRLGWAVQEQLETALDKGGDVDGGELNPNALDQLDDFLNACECAGIDADEARTQIADARSAITGERWTTRRGR